MAPGARTFQLNVDKPTQVRTAGLSGRPRDGRPRGGGYNDKVQEPYIEPGQPAPTVHQLHQYWIYFLHCRTEELAQAKSNGHRPPHSRCKLNLKSMISTWRKDARYNNLLVTKQVAGEYISREMEACGPLHADQARAIRFFGPQTTAELEQATIDWYISNDWDPPPASSGLSNNGKRGTRRTTSSSRTTAQSSESQDPFDEHLTSPEPAADPAPRIQSNNKRTTPATGADGEGTPEQAPRKKRASTKTYIPGLHTGGYGIMLALWTATADASKFGAALLAPEDETDEEMGEDDELMMTKQEIIERGQQWCTADYNLGSAGAGNDVGGNAGAGSGGRQSDHVRMANGAQISFTPWQGIKTLLTHE